MGLKYKKYLLGQRFVDLNSVGCNIQNTKLRSYITNIMSMKDRVHKKYAFAVCPTK